MTVGPEWKEILLFSLPIMAGQFLQQLYNTVDSIVVSRYGGPTQEISNAMFAAVGSCTSLIFLFLAISLGLANGGGVLVSQLYGARREHELRRAASTLLITQASLGTALAVLGSLGAELLVVGLMRVTDEASRAYAVEYFAIYAVGLIFQYIYNAVAGILRAVGDSRASMYFLCVSAALNTVLDLWFVISFGWGVVGVAVATVIAQAASATVSIVYMMRRYPIFRFGRREFVFDTEKFRICLKLGDHRDLHSFPTRRSSDLALKYDRVKSGWKYGTLMAAGMSLVVAFLLYIFAEDFAKLFSLSGDSLKQAVEYQHWMSYCIILFAAYMPTSGLLQGAGDALWTSMTSFCTLALRVTVAYIMVYALDVGYAACWLNIPFGWTLGILLNYPRYFSRRWMTKRVVRDPIPVDEAEEASLFE